MQPKLFVTIYIVITLLSIATISHDSVENSFSQPTDNASIDNASIDNASIDNASIDNASTNLINPTINIGQYDNNNNSKVNIERAEHKFIINSNDNITLDFSELIGQDTSNTSFYFKVGKLPMFANNTKIIDNKYTYSSDFADVTDHFEIVQKDSNGQILRELIFNIYVGLDPIVENYDHRLLLSGLLAVLLGFILTVVIRKIIRNFKAKFTDIIRTPDMDPSLSLFQFLVWTWIVSFALVFIYCIRILSGAYSISEIFVLSDFNINTKLSIPYNLLILMGISVAVPIASTIISKSNYVSDISEQNVISNAYKNNSDPESAKIIEKKRKENPLGKMFTEFSKPALSRLQMFIWTFIGAFVYLFSLFGYVLVNNQTVEIINLSVPDIDPTLVILMGLSQTAFLGLKTANNWMTIDKFIPSKVKTGDDLTIFGRNFGMDRDSIWIGNTAIKSSDSTHLLSWDDSRIDIKIPPIDTGNHDLIVVKKGASVKAEDKITIENSDIDDDDDNNVEEIKYFTYPPNNIKVKSNSLKQIAIGFDNISIDKDSINDTNILVTRINGDIENLVDKEKISIYNDKDILIPLKTSLEPNLKYRIIIGKDMRTKEGKTIGKDIVWEFETE